MHRPIARMLAIATASLLLALTAPTAAAAQNLLTNGSFELGTNPGLFIDLPGGSTAITGWTVGDFHIDYVNSATWNASDGVRSVDLDGSVTAPPRNGSIFQSFATTAGQQYVVSFDLSANSNGLPLVKQAEVSAAGTVQVFAFNIGAVIPFVPPLALVYEHKSFTFTATEASTTLKFKSLTQLSGSPSGWGAVIDNVVVEAVSPTWTNLGFSLPGVSGAPLLVGTGPLVAGSPGSLVLSSAKPSAPALLFIALAATPTPFKCGTLVPVPVLTTLAVPTNPVGGISLAWAAWPAGLSGLAIHFQWGVQDAAAVCGASLSNAVRASVP